MILKRTLFNVIPPFLVIIGVLFPTSNSGITSNSFYYLFFIIIFGLFFFIPKKISAWNIVVLIFSNILLICSTIFASRFFPDFSFGIYPSFLLLFFLFFTDLRGLEKGKYIVKAFLFITWLIIIIGFAIVIQNEFVLDLILDKYIASYDDLVPNMLALRKPVITFATHSVSALFIFIFLYLNLISYFKKVQLVYLLNAFLLFLLLIFIRSNTSILYSIISIIVFGFNIKTVRFSKIIPFLLLFALGLFFSFNNEIVQEMINSIDINLILSSDKNGIAGRYSEQSPLLPTIDYILRNPFSPVGLTVSNSLYYSDSGFILYTLRGSIILALLIYFGFFKFLIANLYSKKSAYFLFFIVLLFEVGYPILINSRFLLIFPFILIYQNYLTLSDEN